MQFHSQVSTHIPTISVRALNPKLCQQDQTQAGKTTNINDADLWKNKIKEKTAYLNDKQDEKVSKELQFSEVLQPVSMFVAMKTYALIPVLL